MKIVRIILPFKICLVFVCTFFLFELTTSQTKEFFIAPPEGKSYESNYGRLSFIDSRYDSLDHGFVLNNDKKISLVMPTSLQKQLANYLEAVVDTSQAKGELLFQLRKFKIVQKRDIDFEYGYCFIRATTYGHTGKIYHRLADVDTLMILRGGDVTDTLLTDAKKQLCRLVRKSLKMPTDDKLEYGYSDILRLDADEKKNLKVYTTATFTNGIYLTYNSFMNQGPDYKDAKVVFKWNGTVRISVKDKEGKKLKLTGKDIYGFVEKDVPYIISDQGVCVVERKNGYLVYAAKDKVNEDNEEYSLPEKQIEALGPNTSAAIKVSPARGAYGYFVSYIDHVDGTFMRIKRIR
jgi:hypothetical protein